MMEVDTYTTCITEQPYRYDLDTTVSIVYRNINRHNYRYIETYQVALLGDLKLTDGGIFREKLPDVVNVYWYRFVLRAPRGHANCPLGYLFIFFSFRSTFVSSRGYLIVIVVMSTER